MDAIHQFIDQNMALLFFLYGLTFFMLGLVAALQCRPQSNLRLPQNLWILAIFGITHGLAEWGYVFIPLQASSLTRESITLVEIGHIIFLVFSFAFLLQFGLKLIINNHREPQRFVLFLPSVIYGLWLLALISGVNLTSGVQLHRFLTNSEIFGRYLLAIPGALITGLALFKQDEDLVGPILYQARRPARSAAISFYLYALLSGLIVPASDFFPANVVNTYVFHEFFNLPVQIFRLITVISMTYFIFRLLEYIEHDYTCRLEWAECQQSVLNERLKISRDLHDSILQSVYALGLHCETVKHLVETDPEKAKAEIDSAICKFNKLISEIREFIGTLRAETKDSKTLHAQIQEVVSEFKARAGELVVEADLDELLDFCICPNQVDQIANIVREALNNIGRHACASRAIIQAENGKRGLWIKIEDDGKGFRMPQAWRSKFSLAHQGINNMRERARLLGGELDIRSKPGQGTVVSLYLPKDGLKQLCGGGVSCGHVSPNTCVAG
ncbi:MAG: sensor histidine kinase [Firmicutes bacterium]|nr:sensor histidine kinase [Bacillota bacterium]